jgi:hypothetical protein
MHKSASMRSRGGHDDHEMSRICDMQVVGAGLVSAWVNSRDHCGPHVHCADKAGTWEGRIRFSFLNNLATFWDCLTPATDPGSGVFNEISRHLVQHLRRCRAEWWRLHGGTVGCCLANSMQHDAVGQLRRVAQAVYDAATDATELTFANGFKRRMNP